MQKFILLLLLLTFLLTSPGRAQEGWQRSPSGRLLLYSHGGIIRTDTTQRRIHLVFTGDTFADGYEVIKAALDKRGVKASFFFTGHFYRNPDFASLIRELAAGGHYLGAHSDRHLLYAAWEDRDSLLVTRDSFERDLLDNYAVMRRFGIERADAPFFIPPYEWYNQQISDWCRDLGFTLVNFTPGTSANQDWSYPALGKGYYSSDTIFRKILDYEQRHTLNGFILLTHIGVDPRRPDPFYRRLDELLTVLEERGYRFSLLGE